MSTAQNITISTSSSRHMHQRHVTSLNIVQNLAVAQGYWALFPIIAHFVNKP